MDDSRTVWCGNISDQVTEELLYELFLQAAPLEKVRIPTDREGRKSNFAFITFKHEPSVNYALQLLNGTRLFDKPLNVKPRNGSSLHRQFDRNLSQFDIQNERVNQLRLGGPVTPRYDHSPNRFNDHSPNRFNDHSPNRFNDHSNKFNEHSPNKFNNHRQGHGGNSSFRDDRHYDQDSRRGHNHHDRRNNPPYHRHNHNEGRNNFNEGQGRRRTGRYY